MTQQKKFILIGGMIGIGLCFWFATDPETEIAAPQGSVKIRTYAVSQFQRSYQADAGENLTAPSASKATAASASNPVQQASVVIVNKTGPFFSSTEELMELPGTQGSTEIVNPEVITNEFFVEKPEKADLPQKLASPPRIAHFDESDRHTPPQDPSSLLKTEPKVVAVEEVASEFEALPETESVIRSASVETRKNRSSVIPPFGLPAFKPLDSLSSRLIEQDAALSQSRGVSQPEPTQVVQPAEPPAEAHSPAETDPPVAQAAETQVERDPAAPQTIEPQTGAHTRVAQNTQPPTGPSQTSDPAKQEQPRKQDVAKNQIDLSDGITFTEKFTPWWTDHIDKPTRSSSNQRNVDLDSLIFGAMQNAPKLQVLSTEPMLAETVTSEANAKFDPSVFLETKWNDLNDPVGNNLTVGGGLEFLEDHIWNGETGIRRLLPSGGRVELSQKLGFQNSNSTFFTPQDQGTARLALTFNQPLLNGAGKEINRSQIIIAQIDQSVALQQYNRELQKYTTDIVRAYWELYFQRSALLQRHRNYQRALEIYRMLEGRAEFDTVSSQLARAGAAVLARKIEVRVLKTKVLNAETRLRELVRDVEVGQLGDAESIELVPSQFPEIFADESELQDFIAKSMDNRPEIQQALEQIKKASQELNVAENDLLPVLNLVLESYVAGLEGGTGIELAFTEQFGQVKPGYSAGFVMEYPLRNRAATARLNRSQLQLRKLSQQLEDVIGKVVADVEIAQREVDTAFENYKNTIASVQSANADVKYIRERWENFAFIENVDAATPNTLLEQLLDAQQRQSDAEVAFSTAVRNYMNAKANLKLADGTILQQNEIRQPARQLSPTPNEQTPGSNDAPQTGDAPETTPKPQ